MAFVLKVDKNKCIGCGSCEAICPKSFSMKNGKAFLKKEAIETLDCEDEAKESCPVGAISIQKK